MVRFGLEFERKGPSHQGQHPFRVDVTNAVLARKVKECNILDYNTFTNRYASLYFVIGIQDENELLALEIIHRYVEILDKWFSNVCELDIIFNFTDAYACIDELLLAGEMQESSKRLVMSSLTTLRDLDVVVNAPFF